MIEVNEWIFWGVCAMAGIGVLQALGTLLRREPEKDWKTPAFAPPGAAPEGFRWVLVPKQEP